MINICVPTLNNYSGLFKLIESCEKGSVIPDNYYIIDNGTKINSYMQTLDSFDKSIFKKITVVQVPKNIGVAVSWNWFIKNTGEIRIISNDDIIFGYDAIKEFNNAPEGFTYTTFNFEINRFSLFRIDDSIVNKVGYFDEEISPGYGYFEDNDENYRMMTINNINPQGVNAEAYHKGSQTLKNYSDQELEIHHKLFRRARAYYVAKWGGEPEKEIFTVPFNGNKEERLKMVKNWWEY